ncbi:TlpA family protein disulfide reductase [Corynebacterium gerontici]|uniref:Sporulation thiol-disulfide oxidoreductase A n=1 Tax=Corynebacterium gerontici TaxID=2079234 RepID=A0A3G6J5S8_9CORY|nr:TlpA disulfide reductase family protein [Corynebacterium gerontici]AZA12288.1 Sporulation thiol-disulfide oxidoreductase A precursor [Corynebacterium gerontici]
MSMRNTLIASITAFVVILGLLILLIARPASEDHSNTNATAEQAQTEDVEKRPDCPDVTFDVELDCLGGQKIPAKQQLTVVNVWAWWCGPCREELPVVEEFAKAHPEYHVVGVHADQNSANGASMLNELGVDLPSFADTEGKFGAWYALPNVVPTTVLLDEKGNMIGQKTQVFHSAEEMDAAITALKKVASQQ